MSFRTLEGEVTATCNEKHTKYQPPDADWKCPKCGTTADVPDGFFNDNPVSSDCNMLHEADLLRCYRCNHETSGKTFAARLQKAANMVPCPHCKGHGLVPGPKVS